MHRILFWSKASPPDPWVDAASTFPKHAVKAVISHLKAGQIYADGSADQRCQLCGLQMPDIEMTDGSVVWPAMAQHYVMAHKVWSPQHKWLSERLLLHIDTPPPPSEEETSVSEETSSQDDPWDVDPTEPSNNDVLDADEIEPSEAEVLEDSEDSEDLESDPWDLPEEIYDEVVAEKPKKKPVKRPLQHPGTTQAPATRRRRRRPLASNSVHRTSSPSLPVHVGSPSAPVESGTAEQICAAYPRVSPPLAAKIVSVARAVGAHPADLANIIHFESNQTFSASVRNPRTGAVGLIQFDPVSTPHELGITTDQLARLNPVDQLDWVQVKLDRARNGHPLQAPYQLAAAIFYPPAMAFPPHQQLPPAVVEANSGIASANDYLSRVASFALMPGSMPYPPPQSPPAFAPVPSAGDPGLLGGVVGFLKGLMGGQQAIQGAPQALVAAGGPPVHPQGMFGAASPAVPPPALPPPSANGAHFECESTLQARLVAADGTSHGPGAILAGHYRLTVWTGQSWQNMGHVDLHAGKSYRAFQQDGRLKLDTV